MKTQNLKKPAHLIKILVAGGLLCAGALAFQPLMRGQEAVAQAARVALIGSGEYTKFKTPVAIEGAKDPADFANEVYGKSFSISAPGLPAGTYTVEIDETEAYQKSAGGRVMRITAGAVVLADKLDIFVAAGGFAKAYTVKGKVEHEEDAIGGPLTLKFDAIAENAKFNAIRILNAQGQIVASVRAGDLASVADAKADKIPLVTTPAIYNDADKPRDARIDDLISRMSLSEKVGQLMNDAPAISRLGVPAYNYWNEALHGVARAGRATVFPQAIGMAATWDEGLIHNVGDAVSTEGRAKYYDFVKQDKRGIYQGLTMWSPNINIFRDPRWGRGQETYGEDPFLTTRLGVGYITGLQGNDPNYLKTVACAKHFAVHSGPEPGRGGFNVDVAPRDLYETYLPQFQAAVQEAHVGSAMAAYNAIDGVPASANHWLLTDLLRDQWGFKGHVVSDCGAVGNISGAHHYATSGIDGSAKAIRAGLDLECGGTFRNLTKSVAQNLVTEQEIDTALHRVLLARFQLGLFDPPQRVPFSNIPISEVESPEHLELARKTVRESIVLLKNDGILPLDKTKIKKIAVIGFNAKERLNGNYNGDPTHTVTLLEGIQNEAGAAITVDWQRGAPLAEKPNPAEGEKIPGFLQKNPDDLAKAVELAKSSDVVIYVGGLNTQLEGEESHIELPGFTRGDRTSIELPAVQTQLLKALQATGKPVVFVNCTGSAVAMPWEAANLPAIVEAWYPGGEGGTGVADVLFGKANPSGHLPITFYEKTADLPAFTNYSMANRTYRYFTGKPLFAFGHGLSYTSFRYDNLKLSKPSATNNEQITATVSVTNTGARDGDEVVQCYVHARNSSVPMPIRALKAFGRVSLAKGQSKTVTLNLNTKDFGHWDVAQKRFVVEPGQFDIEVGASSADIRARQVLKVTEK